jgi:hypothetical protein
MFVACFVMSCILNEIIIERNWDFLFVSKHTSRVNLWAHIRNQSGMSVKIDFIFIF